MFEKKYDYDKYNRINNIDEFIFPSYKYVTPITSYKMDWMFGGNLKTLKINYPNGKNKEVIRKYRWSDQDIIEIREDDKIQRFFYDKDALNYYDPLVRNKN